MHSPAILCSYPKTSSIFSFSTPNSDIFTAYTLGPPHFYYLCNYKQYLKTYLYEKNYFYSPL